MAGKTGTAQRVSRQGTERLDPNRLPYHLRHQALFIGYAPAEQPTIALALVVEHGGSGSAAAAPVARRIFDAWMRLSGALEPSPAVPEAGP
jgi:penicillin-binding protein 2